MGETGIEGRVKDGEKEELRREGKEGKTQTERHRDTETRGERETDARQVPPKRTYPRGPGSLGEARVGCKTASEEGRCFGAPGLAHRTLATFGTPPKDRHPPLNQLLSSSLACPTSWANIPEIITESLPIWGFMSLEIAWLLEGKGRPKGEIGHSHPLNWTPKISALKWTLKAPRDKW